jgi:hypothetical protein
MFIISILHSSNKILYFVVNLLENSYGSVVIDEMSVKIFFSVHIAD